MFSCQGIHYRSSLISDYMHVYLGTATNVEISSWVQELTTPLIHACKMARVSGEKAVTGGDRMVAELRVEREKSNLVLEELTNLLDGGESFTEKRRHMGKQYS